MIIPPNYQILKSIKDRSDQEDLVLLMLERSLKNKATHQSWILLGICLDRGAIATDEGNQIASFLLQRESDVESIKREFARPIWRFWESGGYNGAFSRYAKKHPTSLHGSTEITG